MGNYVITQFFPPEQGSDSSSNSGSDSHYYPKNYGIQPASRGYSPLEAASVRGKRKSRRQTETKAEPAPVRQQRLTVCNPRNEDMHNQNQLNRYLFSPYYNKDVVNQIVPGKILIGRNEYTFSHKPIGEGSFGTVYSLTDSISMTSLAIKFGESSDEVSIADELNRKIPHCECLRVKAVGKELASPEGKLYPYGYFMELADGTLYEFFTNIQQVYPHLKTNKDEWKNVLLGVGETVRKQMLCIYNMNNDYVYTDLKMANVLFKCRDPNNLSQVAIILGDLGSAVPDDIGSHVSTYPPYEHRIDKRMIGLNNFEKEAVMAWGLGVLLLSFIIDRRKLEQSNLFHKLFYGQIATLSLYELNQLQRYMSNMYGSDIANLINQDPNSRRSIRIPLKA